MWSALHPSDVLNTLSEKTKSLDHVTQESVNAFWTQGHASKPVRFRLIAGPTASGKTALAVAMAQATNGVIINCDSMQVYSDLFIITARPNDAEQQGVTHHLFGHVGAATHYNVAKYLRDVKNILEITDLQRPIYFVGGTGLYFKGLTEGLSPVPEVDLDILSNRMQQIHDTGLEHLYRELVDIDPELAGKLNKNDQSRIIRGLCVFDQTGQKLSHLQTLPRSGAIWAQMSHIDERFDQNEPWVGLFLSPNRAELYQKIDRRFEKMIENGAIDEVKTLLDKAPPETSPVLRAHGVPELRAFLNGQMCLEDAISQAQQNTRHYAKRQITWWRPLLK